MPQAMRSGCPSPSRPPLAAFVNGVLAHSLDYDDTHLPSVLHPSACIVPAALAAAQYAGADGAGDVAAIAVRPGDLRPARHGGLPPGPAQLGVSSNTVSTPPRSAARSAAAVSRPACSWAWTPTALSRHGRRRIDGAGDDRGEPGRWLGQAPALRLGGTPGASAPLSSTAGDSPARLPCSKEGSGSFGRGCDGEYDPAALTSALTDGLGSRGRCRGSSSSPIRPTTSPTRPSTPPSSCGRGGLRPRRRGVRRSSGWRSPAWRTIGEPIEVKRAPQTGYMAQFSGPYAVAAGLLGGGGPGRGPGRLHRRACPRPGAPGADGRISVVADDSCTRVFPYQFPAVLQVRTTDGRDADGPRS